MRVMRVIAFGSMALTYACSSDLSNEKTSTAPITEPSPITEFPASEESVGLEDPGPTTTLPPNEPMSRRDYLKSRISPGAAIAIVQFGTPTSRAIEDDPWIVSDIQVFPIKLLRGTLPQVITIPGGTIGDERIVVSDIPQTPPEMNLLAVFSDFRGELTLTFTGVIDSDRIRYGGEWFPLSDLMGGMGGGVE